MSILNGVLMFFLLWYLIYAVLFSPGNGRPHNDYDSLI